jgi:maltose alpha-D-glucosyltransferase/alpha-amylase
MIDHTPDAAQTLDRWLDGQRWYGDKGRELSSAAPVYRAEAPVAGIRLAIEVTRLEYRDGPAAEYLLLRDLDAPDRDAIDAPAARAELLAGFAERRDLTGETGGRLVWRPLAGDIDWGALSGDSRVFRGEQSNSSIIYGDRAIMKLFRKLREGVNPEVEIGAFLTRETDFRAFPALLGTIDLERDEAITTVAAVQAFVPSVGDAWGWITERIGDPEIRDRTIEAAGTLGARTGQMHIALASGASDAFAPEEATAAYAEAVRAEALAELSDTIEQLRQRGVGGADGLGAALEYALDALRGIQGTMITRIHGDYHLGQVLRTDNEDFAILDFEGEPTRSLAERRAKASPLRDVAGMLRSFDYAAETARRAAGGDTAAIDAWYGSSREAFLDGYDAVVRDNPVLMRGWDQDARASALAALELHKALYEVRYELGNRPDWLEIPLNALRRLAGVEPD